MSAIRALLSAALLVISPLALAWSAKGHRSIAAIAEAELSPAARAQVQALLADEPSTRLASIAVWADEIRDQEAWRHTGRWHFVNFPQGECRYEPARDCRDERCVVGAIEDQRALLRDPATPRAQRIEALKFVVHFIGDVHQPLHAGWGFDRGGNDTQIRFNQMGSNLHALWDGMLIDTLELEPAELVRHLQSQGLPAAGSVAEGSAARWAEQSCRMIEDERLYPERRFIDRAYVERTRPLAEAQMRLAAARLAAALEADLGR